MGLGNEVHLDKGCYTGQEALLRMITYGGVRRRMARVSGSGPLGALPLDLSRDGRRVGRLTSAVGEGDDEQRWTGLAVVRCDPDPPEIPIELPDQAAITGLELLPAPAPLGRG